MGQQGVIGPRSVAAYAEAQRWMPGGVNSPVRAFRSVGMTPFFVHSASGSRITDIDGQTYIDYVCSWGPLIAGHAHPHVVRAIQEAAAQGTSYGAPTCIETQLAQLVCTLVPSIDVVRFVNSGTEATMSAIRLARGYTGRRKIVKCIGSYHGHSDGLLIRAGSGIATLGLPDSPGVLADVAQHTLLIPYNDPDALDAACARHGDDIAAVIIEPIAGNMGVIPPVPGYLAHVRAATQRCGALLIFDEVMTGFRVGRAGAQGRYDVLPDVTCLGKILGGGLPVGAYGGAEAIMRCIAPDGPIYQAGTLSGNPLAMAAGLATLQLCMEDGVYDALEQKTHELEIGLLDAAQTYDVPLTIHRVGSMMCPFFAQGPIRNYEDAKRTNTELFAYVFRHLLKEGVSIPPSPFEGWFLSLVHTADDIAHTIDAFGRALASYVD
ncbi:MAG: glutamate-1-semialdehyde 2,1-aminomutase [Paenibacillaceae bacterium]|nr:glutamate-1-semialdehyde 2,1-aminomutase [Paenibacillaceae bacterium]